MAGSPLQTFGLNADAITSRLPQLTAGGATDVLDSDAVTAIIADAASEVCGVLLAAGISPADVAADTASVGYAHCRRITMLLAMPAVMRAIQGMGFGVSADIDAAETRARAALERIEKNPTMLGFDDESSDQPAAWSSTSDYASLASTNPAVRREWQTPSDGTGGPWW